MRRSEDERDKLVREEGKAARRILRGFFTVLSVAACFVVLCLFAYFFRIASSDRTFRLEDFPNRLKQDIARLNDPNTKIQMKEFFKDLDEEFRKFFRGDKPAY
ncbi:MAG TPA: hypothetical protein VL688_02090 [Verrucomicrobiae bacterium]|jgi:hypothetical protein|nr:hypothetical protein [Verrucomicrobiae bacterium]